jgi:hypothetical protein
MTGWNRFNFIASIVFALLSTVSCSRETSHHDEPAIRVSLCELYHDPVKYEGKKIRISATIARLPIGKYLYPATSCEGVYWYVRFEGGDFGNNALKEIESSPTTEQGGKEFDLEVIGLFDSKYSEELDGFRYRILPLEVRQQSPIRIGRPRGAA